MAKVLFVDDRLGEIIRQWELSGCASNHELLPLEPFDSVERTCQVAEQLQPDIVIIGFGLSKPNANGAEVIRSLRNQGYAGYFVANSGGGAARFSEAGVEVNASADRQPEKLAEALNGFKQN
jgi:hypothetical protein